MIQWLRKYLIPHEGNEFKPHALRNEAALALFALILIVEGAFLSQALLFGRSSGFLALVLPNTLVDETNQQRIALSLQPLHENAVLAAAAQQKANDMAAKSYFAHTSPQGITPWYWFQQVGYKYTYAGENLAVNFSDSQDVTEAWMKSPTHRENIVNPNYTEIGIATAQGTYQGSPTIFVVQLFGRPAATKVAVANTTPKPAATPAPTVKPAATPIPKPKPTITPKPAATPKPTITPRPLPEPTRSPATTPVPVIVPVASTEPLPQPAFVAVEGAASGTAAVGSASSGIPAGPTVAAAMVPESNVIQRVLAAPRLTTNVIYAILGFLVALALMLNVFIKVSVQHPRLVLNGLVLLLVLGTLAVFNQQLLLANAQIF